MARSARNTVGVATAVTELTMSILEDGINMRYFL